MRPHNSCRYQPAMTVRTSGLVVNAKTMMMMMMMLITLGNIQQVTSSSTSSSLSSSSSSKLYPFNTPISYVKSAPPCIASKCQDGIVLIAIHIPDMSAMPQADNCGPARIEPLDHATVLLTAGWRVDGMLLAERGREICAQNTGVFGCLGSYNGGGGNGNGNGRKDQRSLDYGTRLGWGLVNYLVQCHVRDSIRSLSTVGLLATTMSGPADAPGELYMVDATGLYPCRALAIGSHSHQLNECLLREDLSDKSVEEVQQILLDIIRDCSQGKRLYNDDKKRGIFNRVMNKKKKVEMDEDSDEVWRIPNESIVEVVTLKVNENTFIRRKEQFMISS